MDTITKLEARAIGVGDFLAIFDRRRATPRMDRVTRAHNNRDGTTTIATPGKTWTFPSTQPLDVRRVGR